MPLQFILNRYFRSYSAQIFSRYNHLARVRSLRQVSTVQTDAEHSKNETKSFEDMPGPRSLPLLGTMHYVMLKSRGKPLTKGILDVQIEGVKDFGRIHKIVVPGFATPLVQLAVPDEVAKVFYLEPKYPKRVDIPIITHFMEEKKKIKGVFFNDGHEWYRHRSVISKRMLRPKEVATYSPMLNDVVTDFMNRLEKIREKASSEFQHEVKDLNKELFKWSFESIAFVLLERRFGCLSDEMNQEARLFIDAVHGWLESVFPVTLLPLSFYKYYKTKPYKQFMSSFENMYKYAEMFIDMRVKELQQQGKLEAGSSAQSDDRHVGFFEFLIANGELSREDILASVIDLIFAGVETTSNTMLWSLYMLGKNQDKQDILYEEITSVLKPGEIPSVDAIGKMPYLKAWIKESLRLYPVLQSNTRLLQDDIVLCGYHVPAGTHVNILSYFMGRDESIFKDAAKFLPERWLRDSDNHTPGVPHAFAVLPFGFGTRMCVGRRIAELEMHLLLARIVHEYQVLYPHEHEVEPEARGSIVPDRDVRVKFIKRYSS